MKKALMWGLSVAAKTRPDAGHTQTSCISPLLGSTLVNALPVFMSQICMARHMVVQCREPVKVSMQTACSRHQMRLLRKLQHRCSREYINTIQTHRQQLKMQISGRIGIKYSSHGAAP
jgi:hypothetical protein